jgi:formylglycine-generating enzyme required for sulfatase activity
MWPLAARAQSGHRLAVLEFESASGVVPVSELQVLGGAARSAATQVVRSDVMVMTVDTMLALQAEGTARCLSEASCAVDVGRVLNATLVMSGRVGPFGTGELVLDLQLYDVRTGGLLSGEQLRSPNVGGLLNQVPLTAKGLLLQAGLSRYVASAVSTAPVAAFRFDVAELSALVTDVLAREREEGCQREAVAGAAQRQALALSAAVTRVSGEVDTAWSTLRASLEVCRGLDDMTQRSACAAQASAFADKAASAKATVGAASYAVSTACGTRNQAVGAKSAPVTSPRVAEARALAAELVKERYRGPGPTWDSATLGTFRLIPSGTFTMGCKPGRDDLAAGCSSDESPAHTVTLSQAYYLMEHEVTQGEWQAVMGSNPSRFTSCGSRCPVESVSWDDAQAFIAKVSARDGVRYRLPTEAEWEWAARGGQGFAYAGSSEVGAVGWVHGSGVTTHAVCGKPRNGYGLCDMMGNVSEWVGDWWGNYSSASVTDPRGPSAGWHRVNRGGSWRSGAWSARVAYRFSRVPGARDNNLGFRLLRSVP